MLAVILRTIPVEGVQLVDMVSTILHQKAGSYRQEYSSETRVLVWLETERNLISRRVEFYEVLAEPALWFASIFLSCSYGK